MRRLNRKGTKGMEKKPLVIASALLTAVLIAGAGTNRNVLAAEEDSSQADETLSSYLIEDASDYVTLGDFSELEVESPYYEVSEEEVDMEVESSLYDFAETKEVTRPAKEEDTLTVSLNVTIEGEEEPFLDEDEYVLDLGFEEFGPEFDEQLTGMTPGEEKSFSCSFDEDAPYEEWVDKTVNFTVSITSIEETTMPEYTDEFVQENFGYDSIEEYESSLQESLQEQYDQQSMVEAGTSALNAAMELSEFSGYPDELYETCRQSVEENYDSFAEMYGMSRDELLEAFGMTEDDMEKEIMTTVNQRLFISAYCEQEGIELTEEDYTAYLEEQYPLYGYEDAETFEQDNGKEHIVWVEYTDKIGALLLEDATIVDAPLPDEEEADTQDPGAEVEEIEEPAEEFTEDSSEPEETSLPVDEGEGP